MHLSDSVSRAVSPADQEIGSEPSGGRVGCWQLGSGLPASLTADRIREVLNLTPRDERRLQDRLDERAGYFWNSTGADDPFYERLRALFRTAGGRLEYESARHDFRRRNEKLFCKLDFFMHLPKTCLLEAGEDGGVAGSDSRLEYVFVESGRRDLEAQFVWGDAIGAHQSRVWTVGGLAALGDEREMREVRAGMIPVGPVADAPEAGPQKEPEALFEEFKRSVGEMRFDDLRAHAIARLRDLFGQLMHLANVREAERDRFAKAFDRFVLEYGAAGFQIDRIGRTIVLVFKWREHKLFAHQEIAEGAARASYRLLDAERGLKSRTALMQDAIDKQDFPRVGELGPELAELGKEKDRCEKDLDDWLARLEACLGGPDDDCGGEAGRGPAGSPASDPGSAFADGDAARGTRDPAGSGANGSHGSKDPPAGAESERGGEPAEARDAESAEGGADERSAVSSESARAGKSAGPARDEFRAPVVRALRDGRFAVAYRILRERAETLPGLGAVRLIATNGVTDPSDAVEAELPGIATEAAEFFRGTVDAAESRIEPAERQAVAVLLACAAFRPALKVPGGSVVEFLRSLDESFDGCPALRALVRVSADKLATTQLPLTPESLALDWDGDLAALRSEASRWIEAERSAKLPYAPATDVWHRLLEPWNENGKSSIGELFRILDRVKDKDGLGHAKRIAEVWKENADREIDRVHHARHGGNATVRIDGRARIRLREKVAEAIAFVRRWEACLAGRPEGAMRFLGPIAQALREAAEKHGRDAVREAERLGGDFAEVSSRLLTEYLRTTAGEAKPSGDPGLRLQDLLEGEFLVRTPVSSPLTAKEAAALLEEPEPDAVEAAASCMERGDFARADAILDYAYRRERLDEARLESHREDLRSKREEADRAFEERFDRTIEQVSKFQEQGSLGAEDAGAMHELLDQSMQLDSGAHDRRIALLDRVERQLDQRVRRLRSSLRKEFKAIRHPPAKLAHQFEKAVRENRFRDARQLLEQAQGQVAAA